MYTNNYNNVHKTLLCEHYITSHKCIYGNRCKYAHGIKDQAIKPSRKLIYQLMFNEKLTQEQQEILIEKIEKDESQLAEILYLTQVCPDCKKNSCIGGRNCKNGAMNEKDAICKKLLLTWICQQNCIRNHIPGMKRFRRVLQTLVTQFNKKNIKTEDNIIDIYNYCLNVINLQEKEENINIAKEYNNLLVPAITNSWSINTKLIATKENTPEPLHSNEINIVNSDNDEM